MQATAINPATATDQDWEDRAVFLPGGTFGRVQITIEGQLPSEGIVGQAVGVEVTFEQSISLDGMTVATYLLMD